MANKVFIGVGHGGSDSGAVGFLVEKDINLKMAIACRDFLEKHGVLVLMSRTTDETESLNEKIRECNNFRAELAVDIHNNAGGGKGFEVFHTIGGGVGKTLAQNIESEIKSIGQNSRGIKTKRNASGYDYFGFIRLTNMPSVICEGLFVDNQSDACLADTDEECKKFGEAYAKGILKTLGISVFEQKLDNKISSVKKNENDGKLYKVQVGAFKDKNRAEQLLVELRGKGLNAFITTE